MSDDDRGHPIQVALFVLVLVGGGWWFFRNYEVEGLDEVSVYPKSIETDESTLITYRDAPPELSSGDLTLASTPATSANPFDRTGNRMVRIEPDAESMLSTKRFRSLKIASWALDGFGPTKFSNPLCRQNVAKVVGQFDVVALQQVASIERDLIPRLVEMINQSGRRYDYVIGKPTGPSDRPEQLAFIFDTTRVLVDRRQTYSVEDPADEMTFDPLVAWFRAAEPPSDEAWTFSLVNVRVDLARAPQEVALLPTILEAIANDGRGEDDVLLAGLYQADDAYLLGTLNDSDIRATVQSRPTDIFGRYQTSNLMFRESRTSEFVGRGGVLEFVRQFDLTLAEAETVTSHLPVYGEFTVIEGGQYE